MKSYDLRRAEKVVATVAAPTGVKRTIDVIESFIDGSTIDNVQSFSILFDGKNGTLDGISVSDGYVSSFSPNGDQDTVTSIDYVVPTTKGQRVIINYVL